MQEYFVSTVALKWVKPQNMKFLPGDFASEAWNTEKLIKAYEAKKKLEIIGAMTFNSAVKTQRKTNSY